jgi:nucleoside-diphosphate-sugar epimerase
MKVAVTGGTGFIGSRVVRILRERGHEVVCLVRNPDKAGELAAMGATLARGDILDADSMKAAFAGAEGVLHIAASYELGVVGKRADEALRKNLDGTRLALEAARDAGAKKIVYTSSIIIYGNTHGEVVPEGWRPPRIAFPSTHPTFYALTKARAHWEIVVPMIEAGAPIVIVQPGGVIGPRDHSTYRVLWTLLARGLPATVGSAVYGIVDVEDCALGHVLALERGKVGESYHLVDENVGFPDLYRRAAAASGLRGRAIVLPAWLLRGNAALVSLLERVVRVPDILSSDALRAMAGGVTLTVQHDKARRELGWSPRPMAEALRAIMTDELQRLGKPLPPLLSGPPASA